MLKTGKKGQNIWKFGQKCTKFETSRIGPEGKSKWSAA